MTHWLRVLARAALMARIAMGSLPGCRFEHGPLPPVQRAADYFRPAVDRLLRVTGPGL